MLDATPQTEQLRGWLTRMRAGDPVALEELLRHVGDRLRCLTRKMLRHHPAVRRWTQTDDVFQGALMRLLRALPTVQPHSIRQFFALAAQQIRRELIDLARHYYGPHGQGTHHVTPINSLHRDQLQAEPVDPASEPESLSEWYEFHCLIDTLPEEQREVVGLLFYQGLTQAEAAAILNVTVRTVQRRWHAALVALHKALNGA